jgi:cardiolipin synthase
MSGPVLIKDLADAPNADGLNMGPGAEDGWVTPPPVTLGDGTRLYLYKDGEGLKAGLRAIEAAKRRICLEMYIFANDATGKAYAEALAKRARDGLAVYLIYDSFGSIGSKPLIRTMRAAGVKVAEFHPLLPWHGRFGWRPFGRDHRKLLVCDDEVAGLGGINIGDEYAATWVAGWRAKLEHLMRDQAIGVVGPSARPLALAFAATWRYIHRGGPIRRAFFAHNLRIGPVAKGRRIGKQRSPKRRRDAPPPIAGEFAVLASAPTLTSPTRPFLSELLQAAESSIEIIMAYFAPDDEFIENLCAAADRGVHVRLILPARSDLGIMIVAAHSFYAKLLSHHIEIFERQNAVLHAKTIVIDGRIVGIGSANLDYRSVESNLEISAIVTSAAFAADVRRMLDHDVKFSKRICAEEWRRRPMRDRFIQWMVSRIRYVL